MNNIALPQNLALIGIGGAGKELVFRVLEQKWILDHYLGPNSDMRNLKVYTIDTAKGEHSADLETKKKIQNSINEKLQEEYSTIGGTIQIENPICLTKFVNVNRPSDLTKKEVREAVKKTQANVWWLEDPECGLEGWFRKLVKIDPNLDQEFTGGSYRRRGIAKAVFYKALSETNPLNFNVSGSQVAVVVGLGGGTGSGLFFDVANELKDRGASGVTLFAVLPTIMEGEIEKSNAYVALSELEFAKLTDESPFNHVILLPFEPTRYSSGGKSRAVDEFDSTFPYTLTSFYHALVSNVRINIKKYAGFILADGCIIRYDIENIVKIRNQVRDAIKKLEESTIEEKKFRQILDERLIKIEDIVGSEETNPTLKDYQYLNSRLEEIELWNSDAFGVLGYETVKEILDEINYQKSEGAIDKKDNYDDFIRYINGTLTILNKVKSTKLELKDDVDKELLPILTESFEMIKKTGDQIKIFSSLNTNISALQRIVKGQGYTVQDEENIRKFREEIDSKIEVLIANKNSKLNSLNELNNKPSEIEQKATKICNTLSHRLNELFETKKEYKTLQKDVDSLNHRVNKFVEDALSSSIEDLNDERDWLNSLEFSFIERELNRLSHILPEQNDFNIRDFLKNIALFYYYRKMNQLHDIKFDKSGFFAKITGKREMYRVNAENFKIDSNKVYETIKGAYESIGNESMNWGLSINPEKINISIEMIVSYKVDNKIKTLTNEIENFIKEKADEVEIEKSTLNNNYATPTHLIDSLIKDIKDSTLRKENFSETKILLETEIEKFDTQINEAERNVEVIGLVRELIEETRESIIISGKKWDEFKNKMDEINKLVMNRKIISGETATYIEKLEPAINVLSEVEEKSNIGFLFDRVPDNIRSREINKIMQKTIQSVKEMLLNRNYLGVNAFKIEYNNDIDRWNFNMGISCISSLCDNILYQIDNDPNDTFRSLVNDGLNLDIINDAIVTTNNAAEKWDVGITLFALPTFLDNIINVITGNGYKDAFDNRSYKLKTDKDQLIFNILHHVFLLENGKMVYRENIFQSKNELKEAAKFAKEEANGIDISDEIIGLHNVEIFGECINENKKEIQNH